VALSQASWCCLESQHASEGGIKDCDDLDSGAESQSALLITPANYQDQPHICLGFHGDYRDYSSSFPLRTVHFNRSTGFVYPAAVAASHEMS